MSDPIRSARRRLLASIAVAVALASHALHAQDYPTRPIRIVVPFSPGGAVDGPTRVVAQELSKRLSQQVVVENRPGAGATIGSELVAKSAPDGYTLLLASQTNAISATLYSKLQFEPIDDFAPIALIGREPGVLVVNPSLPAEDVAGTGRVRRRSEPGQIDYASSGNGSGQHLFVGAVRLDGRDEAHPRALQGQRPGDHRPARRHRADVDPGTAGMVGHIKAGKLRALAVTGDEALAAAARRADARRVRRPRLRGLCLDGAARAEGHARRDRRRLYRELMQVLATGRGEGLHGDGRLEIVGSTPAEFDAYFREERDRWARVIRETGAKVD